MPLRLTLLRGLCRTLYVACPFFALLLLGWAFLSRTGAVGFFTAIAGVFALGFLGMFAGGWATRLEPPQEQPRRPRSA